MFSKLPHNVKGIILAFIGFTGFAVCDANAKYMSQYYDSFEFVGLTAIFTLTFLMLLSPFLGGVKQTFKTDKLKIQLARALVNPVLSILIMMCLKHLSIAQLYTMVFTCPFITTLLAIPLFKERVHRHGWIAITTGFIGVLVVMRPGFTVINPWLLAAFGLAFVISTSFLLSRALGAGETILSLALFPALGNIVFITPIALYSFGLPPLEHLPFFILQGAGLIIAISCITSAFKTAKTSIIGPMNYIQIVWAIIFGYLIFGNVPNVWTIIGGAIIVGSGIYLLLKEKQLQAVMGRD